MMGKGACWVSTQPQPPTRACLPSWPTSRPAPEPLTHFGHGLGGKRALESPDVGAGPAVEAGRP